MATIQYYPLSLHDALPILELARAGQSVVALERGRMRATDTDAKYPQVIDELNYGVRGKLFQPLNKGTLSIRHDMSQDRKSTRLNSSHVAISYAVFCLKKKT